MKIKFVIILLVLTSLTYSQGSRRHQYEPKERIEQLEKIKLLEVLELNEEDAIRFFARRNEFQNENEKTIEERKTILSEMEQAIEDGKTENEFDYQGRMDKLDTLDKKLVQQRIEFINSLNDLLTIEQTAKLVVFESKFMKEVRDALMRRRRK